MAARQIQPYGESAWESINPTPMTVHCFIIGTDTLCKKADAPPRMVYPLSRRLVMYLKFSADDAYISIRNVGISLNTPW